MRFPLGIEIGRARRFSEPPPVEEHFVAPAEVEVVHAGRDMAALPVSTERQPAASVYGADGDSWYLDVLAGGPDVNPLLTGRAKYETYNEMRLSDPTVRSSLWMFKLPIRQASWKVEPASEDPVDVTVAECIAWQFGLGDDENAGRLNLTWDESLQQALLFLDWGAMFEEIVWGDVETWVDADGDPHLIRPIAQLAPRFPSTVIQVRRDHVSGEILEVVQDLPGTLPIPGEDVLHYALDREGRNWWGVSLLRPMYGPWKLKKALEITGAIGWDRFAIGTPIVRYPKGGGDTARQQAEQIGRNYRSHERGYVVLEGAAAAGNVPADWDVELKNGSGTLADPSVLIRLYDEQIATAGLQMFTRLGMTGQGSRAVGEVLSDPFYMGVQAVAKHVVAVRMKRAVRRFVDVNFGRDVSLPRLSVSKIQSKNVPVMARAIADLSAAGLTFTDPDTQNDIRDQLDLDHLPDGLAGLMEGLPPEVGVTPAPQPEDTVTISQPQTEQETL